MDLLIAEKPSLAEAIAAAMPGTKTKTRTHITTSGGAVLTWCFGHLLEQVMPDGYDERLKQWSLEHLPFIPSQWRMVAVKKTASQLSAIKELLKGATRVIHAGDPDQEGQLIVDELLAFLGNRKPVVRILVSDYTTAKVKAALADLRPNTAPQFAGWSEWALCRSRLDWLFGINLTRAYTLRGRAAGYDGVLSVGRVQTPTLAIVAARDAAIENFKSIPFYVLRAKLEAAGITFDATWQPREGQAGLDEDGRLVDPAVASAMVTTLTPAAARVASFDAKAGTRAAPLPFDVDTLQGEANERFGYTAAQTLEIAQALYETHKLTTYPRTDCRYLSRAQHAETPARLQAIAALVPGLAGAVKSANPALMGAAFNDEKVTAHHGIVPTVNERGVNLSTLSERERNVYELVATNFIAQFYPAEQYEQTTILADVGGQSFKASGRRVTLPGWTVLFGGGAQEETESDDDEDAKQALPRVAQGQALNNKGVSAQPRKTTPPARFTEKTLLKAMANVHQLVKDAAAKARLKEGQGIGTPATRANVIEELKKRDFLSVKGRQLTSTPAARALLQALPHVAKDPAFTGLTEQALDQVAAGKLQSAAFMAKTAQLVTTLVEQAKTATVAMPQQPKIACPVCKQGELKRRKGSNGPFWSCTRYQEGCKASYDDSRGKPRFVKAAGGAKKSAAKKTTAKKAASGGTTRKTATRGKSSHSVAKRTNNTDRSMER